MLEVLLICVMFRPQSHFRTVQALVAELKLANCISSTIISLLKYNKTHTISFANFEKKKCCLST